MSFSERRNWLIAYDIADHLRLGRVHRFLKNNAIPVQYSVFVFEGDQATLGEVLAGIEERIDTAEDDVRAYHLPRHCEVAMLGNQELPEGIVLNSNGLEKLLRNLKIPADMPVVDTPAEAE